MNHLFLLKLIAELLSSDKPTADEIGVAKKILKEMIAENENLKTSIQYGYGKTPEEAQYMAEKYPILSDPAAEKARQELAQ